MIKGEEKSHVPSLDRNQQAPFLLIGEFVNLVAELLFSGSVEQLFLSLESYIELGSMSK